MQLGFVSAILPDLSLEEVFDFAARTGYDCVEVMCWPREAADRRYAGVTHLDVVGMSASRAQEVRRLCRESGVSISGLGYYPNLLTPDEAEARRVAAHLQRVIEAAARLEILQVNTFVGRDWRLSIDENWPRFVEVWTPLLELAARERVRIGIENCPMLFTRDEWPGGKNLAASPAIWRRMFQQFPSEYFGLNYDPSHLVWQQMDHLLPLREFSSRLFHLHAKDVRVDRERLNDVGILAYPLEYHAPRIPGRGDIDWGRYCDEVRAVGYDGSICVEVEDRDYEDSLDSRKRALEESLACLRPHIGKAKRP